MHTKLLGWKKAHNPPILDPVYIFSALQEFNPLQIIYCNIHQGLSTSRYVSLCGKIAKDS
jgi:hypothetical protein